MIEAVQPPSNYPDNIRPDYPRINEGDTLQIGVRRYQLTRISYESAGVRLDLSFNPGLIHTLFVDAASWAAVSPHTLFLSGEKFSPIPIVSTHLGEVRAGLFEDLLGADLVRRYPTLLRGVNDFCTSAAMPTLGHLASDVFHLAHSFDRKAHAALLYDEYARRYAIPLLLIAAFRGIDPSLCDLQGSSDRRLFDQNQETIRNRIIDMISAPIPSKGSWAHDVAHTVADLCVYGPRLPYFYTGSGSPAAVDSTRRLLSVGVPLELAILVQPEVLLNELYVNVWGSTRLSIPGWFTNQCLHSFLMAHTYSHWRDTESRTLEREIAEYESMPNDPWRICAKKREQLKALRFPRSHSFDSLFQPFIATVNSYNLGTLMRIVDGRQGKGAAALTESQQQALLAEYDRSLSAVLEGEAGRELIRFIKRVLFPALGEDYTKELVYPDYFPTENPLWKLFQEGCCKIFPNYKI